MTDETATTWLANYLTERNPSDWAQIYPALLPTSSPTGFDPLQGVALPVPQLQCMARLWLQKDLFNELLTIAQAVTETYDVDKFEFAGNGPLGDLIDVIRRIERAS